MRNRIACCGLDCEKCDAYIATVTDDAALREKTARLWAELNHAPITADMIRCTGCREEGVKTPFCQSMCGIRRCAREKGAATCADCPRMDACDTLSAVLSNSPEAGENLRRLKRA